MPVELPISEWADLNGVPLRTAQQWAKNKTIRAKKKKLSYQVQTTRLIETWVVNCDIKPPSSQVQ